MEKIVDVQTGMVGTGDAGCQVISSGIGSCVVAAVWEATTRTGGIAHIMLPGRAPEKTGIDHVFRYAYNGILRLITDLECSGADRRNMSVYLAGGGNVLGCPDDTICTGNIESVHQIIAGLGLTIRAESLGGNKRRRVRLDLAQGKFFCATGDGDEVELG